MARQPVMALFTALLLACATAGAQQPDAEVWRPDPGQSAPVHIDADELDTDNAQMAATFSGNVRVRQGDMVLRCAQARVWYRAATPGRAPTVDHLECRQ
jgi:lipopolysaccharide export system protein LptA